MGKPSESTQTVVPAPLTETEIRLRDALSESLLGPSSTIGDISRVSLLDRLGSFDQPAPLDPRIAAILGQFGPQLFAAPAINFDLISSIKNPLGTGVSSDFLDFSGPGGASRGHPARGGEAPFPKHSLQDLFTKGAEAGGKVLAPPPSVSKDPAMADLITQAKQQLLDQLKKRLTPPVPEEAVPGQPGGPGGPGTPGAPIDPSILPFLKTPFGGQI